MYCSTNKLQNISTSKHQNKLQLHITSSHFNLHTHTALLFTNKFSLLASSRLAVWLIVLFAISFLNAGVPSGRLGFYTNSTTRKAKTNLINNRIIIDDMQKFDKCVWHFGTHAPPSRTPFESWNSKKANTE